MIEIHIPSFGVLKLEKAVFDFNGTLANSGALTGDIVPLMEELSRSLKIYVLTGDTFSSASSQLEGLPCEVVIAPKENQAEFKGEFVRSIGSNVTVAVGNGRNDSRMLKVAALGISVFNGEGIAAEAIINSDIVVQHIKEVFEILMNPKKIIATLRG